MKTISKQLKEFVKFVCAAIYFVYLKVLRKKQSMVVIYYHCIRSEDIAGFRKQMEYLANTCTVVKPSNIKTSLANGSKQMVAITFDDGFEIGAQCP